MSGSSSAPARKVSTTAPEAARNRTHSELAAARLPRPNQLVDAAAATPTQISTNAIDIRNEEARRAEITARASHRDAVIKIGSIQESSVPTRCQTASIRLPPHRRQLYGYGSSSVGVISLAEAVIDRKS